MRVYVAALLRVPDCLCDAAVDARGAMRYERACFAAVMRCRARCCPRHAQRHMKVPAAAAADAAALRHGRRYAALPLMLMPLLRYSCTPPMLAMLIAFSATLPRRPADVAAAFDYAFARRFSPLTPLLPSPLPLSPDADDACSPLSPRVIATFSHCRFDAAFALFRHLL